MSRAAAKSRVLSGLGKGPPQIEKLGEQDWVTMSQAGLQPIRAGRFTVHTPTYAPEPERINFEIDAGLAFGTGQHATTAGCLAALDRLEMAGEQFENIADIGTGTGLLAFAALKLWPQARCIATDIDPIAIDVSRDNAAINGVPLGHGAGELLLSVADGMDSPLLAARAPFDLIIANILAGPLIELAPRFREGARAGRHGHSCRPARQRRRSGVRELTKGWASTDRSRPRRMAGAWCLNRHAHAV